MKSEVPSHKSVVEPRQRRMLEDRGAPPERRRRLKVATKQNVVQSVRKQVEEKPLVSQEMGVGEAQKLKHANQTIPKQRCHRWLLVPEPNGGHVSGQWCSWIMMKRWRQCTIPAKINYSCKCYLTHANISVRKKKKLYRKTLQMSLIQTIRSAQKNDSYGFVFFSCSLSLSFHLQLTSHLYLSSHPSLPSHVCLSSHPLSLLILSLTLTLTLTLTLSLSLHLSCLCFFSFSSLMSLFLLIFISHVSLIY